MLRYDLFANRVSEHEWHHVAATLQRSTKELTLYLDGVRVARGFVGALSTGNALPLSIGRNGPVGGGYWKGKIDDVRVWSVLRTPVEIAASYRAELASAPPGLAGNWKLNEGRGTTAADSAGTAAQNLTLFGGATWWGDVPQAASGVVSWWDALSDALGGAAPEAVDVWGRLRSAA